MKKGVVLDRGSTIFFLDSSGTFSLVHDGIDSVITDSVANRILIQPDSGITNSLCPGTPSTSFAVSILFDQCTGIILDSLKQITPSAPFTMKFTPGFLADSTIRIPFTYHASHPGWDTAHYRLRFHSPITQNVEQRFFDVIGFGKAGSPDMSLSTIELDFPQTGIDSTHTLSVNVNNPGCGILNLDTVVSTNPAIFILGPKTYPVTVAPGKSATFTVTFNPHFAGDYLESIEVETNIGNRYITLRGTSSSHPLKTADTKDQNGKIRIAPNPADNVLWLTSDSPLPEKIKVFDLLGRQMLEITTDKGFSAHYDLHSLPNGYYFFDCGNELERIVVRH
jgi:hypothetical protein